MVLKAAWQEEVLQRLVLLLVGRTGGLRVKHSAGGDPPVTITVQVNITTTIGGNTAETAPGLGRSAAPARW